MVTGSANVKRKEGVPGGSDNPSPATQATEGDPAPVTHAHEEMAARGRYESAEPFRSRKGDRFS